MLSKILQYLAPGILGEAPGIHGYVASSIPAVTPRYCTITTRNALRSTKKNKKTILMYLHETVLPLGADDDGGVGEFDGLLPEGCRSWLHLDTNLEKKFVEMLLKGQSHKIFVTSSEVP
jgi:hypothetical protein